MLTVAARASAMTAMPWHPHEKKAYQGTVGWF